MMRRKCLEKGHKWEDFPMLPLVFCHRWRCDAQAVSRWADPRIAEPLHNAIPEEDRVPPVELAAGRVVRKWTEGSRA